jgi:ARP2/3 complex 16 kDa subunit (p16-Arc)
MASSFRRINVDQYDEEHGISEAELVPENPLSDDDLVSMVTSISQQVRSFLQRGDSQSALSAVLSVQPYGTSPALTQAKVCSGLLNTNLLGSTYGECYRGAKRD